MPETTEQTERAAYWSHVNLLADFIEEEIDDYPDDVHQFIWEEVDSSEYVIYTNKALQVLQYSEEGPEEWNHLAGDSPSWQEAVTAMAFTALRADVREELADRHGSLSAIDEPSNDDGSKLRDRGVLE